MRQNLNYSFDGEESFATISPYSRKGGKEWEAETKKICLELTPMDDSVLQQSSIMGDDETSY